MALPTINSANPKSKDKTEITNSITDSIGNIANNDNNKSTSSLSKTADSITGNNTTTVTNSETKTPKIESSDSLMIEREGNETQEAIENTKQVIQQEGNQTQAAVHKIENTIENQTDQQNKNTKKEEISETQNERGQVQRHRELISAINDCCLGKLNSSAKNGMGISNTKSEDSPILGTLMSFIPMLLPVLAPLLGLVAPLLPILAAIATGVGLGALLAKWIGGNNVFEDAFEGAKQFLETGSITGDVEKRQRVFDQSLEADRRNARNNISDTPLKESQSDIANQTAAYQRPDLFGIKDQIADTGEFKDIAKREEAFNVASNILSSFKITLDEYKGKVRTTGGREVFSEKIKPYVLEVWPRYETTMKRAGLDPLKEAPGEFAEYAPALEVLYNDIKSEKSDAQVSRVAQTIAETGPKNWKSMGVSVRDVEKVTDFRDTVKDTVTESSTQSTNNLQVKGVVETGSVAASEQDKAVTVPDSVEEGKGGNINIAVAAQGSPGSSTPTPQPSAENVASKASGETAPDSRIVAACIDVYNTESTFA